MKDGNVLKLFPKLKAANSVAITPTKVLNISVIKNTLITAVRKATDIALVYPPSKSLFTPNKYRLNPIMTRNLTKASLLHK